MVVMNRAFSPPALCEDPPEIVSGTVTPTGNSVGDTTTYSCDPGFNVVGTTTLICQQVSTSTAEWMPDPPTCERTSSYCCTSNKTMHYLGSAGITVRFALPSYTFTESGVQGSIDVIRTGVPSSPFSIRVTGGKLQQFVSTVYTETVTFAHQDQVPSQILSSLPL